jgi:hypothetical protein
LFPAAIQWLLARQIKAYLRPDHFRISCGKGGIRVKPISKLLGYEITAEDYF